MQAQVIERSQTSVLNLKRAEFKKLRNIRKDSIDGNPKRKAVQDDGKFEIITS